MRGAIADNIQCYGVLSNAAEYLSFVKGVVDTEDLPLNISRETLQENVVIRKIGQTVTKQVLGHLEKLAASDADRYAEFWRSHGKLFKLGHTDWANREKFAGLLRCNTSHHDDAKGLSSLDDYIGRAREGQKDIWYISAPNREAARLNPHLEIFRKKGLEVLFLYEPIDEFVMDALGNYKDFALKAVEHADAATLDAFPTVEERKEAEPLAESDAPAFDALLARMKELLGDKVTEVRVSHRLSDSPREYAAWGTSLRMSTARPLPRATGPTTAYSTASSGDSTPTPTVRPRTMGSLR